MTLFFESLVQHFGWWLAALWPGRHAGAPLSARRLLFLLLLYPAFLVLQLLHWLGLLCDELFFRGYRRVEVNAPVFILGIPRSGTTFLHRSLAADRARFTSCTTWEALLAPSITERRLLRAAARIDRALGAPLQQLARRLCGSATSDFNTIHEVGLHAPEEDYLCLLPAGACFILLLAFPFAPRLRQLGQLDTLPARQREQLLQFYRSILQRQLYCHPGRQLLSKNAAFASWAQALKTAFPDAKFLVCVREPGTALSSQLSSLAPARHSFGTDPDGTHTATLFTRLYAHGYASLDAFIRNTPPDQATLIAQSDLHAAPVATITAALDQVQLQRSTTLNQSLAKLQPGNKSAHQHDPKDFFLDPAKIAHSMQPHYESLLRSPNRVKKMQTL